MAVVKERHLFENDCNIEIINSYGECDCGCDQVPVWVFESGAEVSSAASFPGESSTTTTSTVSLYLY